MPFLLTMGSFSILYFFRVPSACSRVMPSGAVIRLSLVMIFSTGTFMSFWKRKSRLVMIPTSFAAIVHDGNAPDLEFAHDVFRFTNGGMDVQRHGIEDETALRAFHFSHLLGLQLDLHVLVDEAQAAFQRNTNGQFGFGYRVHSSRYERNVQR